ncbi:hypothetical protein SAMN05421839_10667 [Halolactibacillus halophilus]|uniref:YdhG-like domain-containing protein n=1 Tax=Halolactibacillus halophilus TaxID=306540 RepID=A0A1I5MRD2_9BACI|nr:hypothetical protein SAMN05421839_10667 [Halolactibacillus halophilus]
MRASVLKTFDPFLQSVEDPSHRERLTMILQDIKDTFPELEPVIKWNQPMFVIHGTYIIGFSIAKAHLALAPEEACLEKFESEINQAGYQTTKQLVKIKWADSIDLDLIQDMVRFNIEDKQGMTRFWR